MTRKEQIPNAYKLTGGTSSFYDGMMTCSALPGKAICRIVWNMDGEKNLRYLERALSGGEQQRVCIARAFINYTELLLADEPTGKLDEANENIVLDIFAQLHREGTTLGVTYDPEVAKAVQRMVTLGYGKTTSDKLNANFNVRGRSSV